MNQQSSVEWLVEQLKPAITLQEKYINEFLHQAKQMHKEEIEFAYSESFRLRNKPYSTAAKYYNETFGGNNE